MTVKKDSNHIAYPSQLAMFLGLAGGGLIISALASVLIWLMMEGAAMPHTANDILQPKYYSVNMVIQVVSTFFIFFLPTYFFALICYRHPQKFIGFTTTINYKQVLLVILILIMTFPLAAGLGELNKIFPIPKDLAVRFRAMENAREAQEAAMIHIDSLSKYLISLLVIALLPALFEETFFRGGMQNFLTRWFNSPLISILVTSLIFSLIHLSYYGFLVRFGLGIILGYVFYLSGSLWLSALFHFFFNGIQVTALYIMTLYKSLPAKDFETHFPIWLALPAVLILFYLFHMYENISIQQKLLNPETATVEDELYDWTQRS